MFNWLRSEKESIEYTKQILEKYFTKIDWMYDYQKMSLEDKKEVLGCIAYELNKGDD